MFLIIDIASLHATCTPYSLAWVSLLITSRVLLSIHIARLDQSQYKLMNERHGRLDLDLTLRTTDNAKPTKSRAMLTAPEFLEARRRL